MTHCAHRGREARRRERRTQRGCGSHRAIDDAVEKDEDQRSRIAAAYRACDSALAVELGG
jgi:hypothetical protein